MSTVLHTEEGRTRDLSPAAPPPALHPKRRRVLACVLCQQRKVKCDRKYPCANCVKSRVQCVPATQVSRPRRRRFPERELLERLRTYEDLLRQKNISFEPLHKISVGEKKSPNEEASYDSEDEQQRPAGTDWVSPSTTANSETVYETKNIWHAMNQKDRDVDYNTDSSDDNLRQTVVTMAWDHLFENTDHLLFGSPKTVADISTLHPEPVQIFRLWQIYLDNVDPLLKVTHTPSLQGRIIEAASDIPGIKPALEALMFSIYCMSISSLAVDDCHTMFGSPKSDLLTKYQFGCQQALSNCGYLRTSERDCLTALHLYLVSVRPSTVPQSLSSMLGVAIRIAQRMGIHSESSLANCTVLEAEMRRRLWWSLMLFDTRIAEMADTKITTLNPTWNCRIPLNVNDSDIRLEMKDPPKIQGKSTETLFAVVRSELGDFIRHTTFYLDITDPALKSIAKDVQKGTIIDGSEVVSLEMAMEEKYLKFCDPENPLHFMTIWMTRAYIARCRLMEHLARYSSSSVHQTDAQRDAASLHALNMLECDTKIMTSPLTAGFHWLVDSYFPFVAYIQIVQNLKQRPVSGLAKQAWEVMSNNFEARLNALSDEDAPPFRIFARLILQAWEAREAIFNQSRDSLVAPRIVAFLRRKLAQLAQDAQHPDTGQPNEAMDLGVNSFHMPMPMDFGSQSLLYSMGGYGGFALAGPGAYLDMSGLALPDFDATHLDCSAME